MPRRWLLVILSCTLAPSALAGSVDTTGVSWSGQVGIASGLVYRGIRLNGESVVPGLNLAVEHKSGFYLHGWFTRVALPYPDEEYDYAYEYNEPDAETQWQTLVEAGYNWRLTPAWSISLGHSWYRYSEQVQDNRPDYREWMISVDYNGLLIIDYAHTEELWGLEERQQLVSLGVHWPFTPRLIGAATLGWVGQEGLYDDRYHYLRLNLGYLLAENWSAQLQFHHSNGMGYTYGDHAARGQWVAQLNWHW